VMMLDEEFERLDDSTNIPSKTDYSYDIVR
jgi:hypothetical protein